MRSKWFALTLILLLVIIFSGCSHKTLVTSPVQQVSEKPGPKEVDLQKKVITNAHVTRLVNFKNVSQIINGNSEGELLGFLWDNIQLTKPRQIKSLYLINPSVSKAWKVFDPEKDFRIYSAALDKNWLVITEQSQTKWAIYSINRNSKKMNKIEEGSYFAGGGLDYPSLALYNGSLVYDVSTKTPDTMISKINQYDLNAGKKCTLKKIKGIAQYLGPPSIYENYVVFSQGEWTKNMKSVVYLYNLKNNDLEQISYNHMAVKPSICGKYVVWSGYDADKPEIKNIMLYNLETKLCTNITDATPKNHYEYWGATISHGIVTWNRNLSPYHPSFYSTSLRENESIKTEGEQVALYGSWYTWRDPKATIGTYIIGLSDFFPELEMSGIPNEHIQVPYLSKNITENTLAKLLPPESFALYEEGLLNRRIDIIKQLQSPNGWDNREMYINDLMIRRPRISPRIVVSTEYFIEGDRAFVGDMSISNMTQTHHLTKENGIWKVDMLSGQ